MMQSRPKYHYDYRVIISYQNDVDNIYVELSNDNSGEIIVSTTATVGEHKALLNAIDYVVSKIPPVRATS